MLSDRVKTLSRRDEREPDQQVHDELTYLIDPFDDDPTPSAGAIHDGETWFDPFEGEWVFCATTGPGRLCEESERDEPPREKNLLRTEFERRRLDLPDGLQNDPNALTALSREVFYEDAGDILHADHEREGSRIINRGYALDRSLQLRSHPILSTCRPRPRNCRRAPRPVRRRRAISQRGSPAGDSDSEPEPPSPALTAPSPRGAR
jgi:hypothetical protein